MLSRSYHAGMDAPSTSKPAAPVTRCLDTTLEYLLLETIRYYATLADQVAAVHAVETMGFRIGSQLAERLTEGEDCMSEPLVKMRFICRQFWSALFGRHVGGLKTNHRGRFVLEESSMAWLLPLRPAASETPAALQAASAAARARAAARKKIADLYVALVSSCIRGALSHLNLACSVVGNCSAAPTCTFTVDLPSTGVAS